LCNKAIINYEFSLYSNLCYIINNKGEVLLQKKGGDSGRGIGKRFNFNKEKKLIDFYDL